MSRLPRLDLENVPQHVIQRGNNKDVCFASNTDYAAYAHWLKLAAKKYSVDVHAWVFMTNHVHLLVTPKHKGGVSKMMQSLGRQYVRYFNFTYQRTGTLWEGRFKACLIDSEAYLLACYRYIELNPVRARMVSDPGEYQWSSYGVNALGRDSTLCAPHVLYLGLGLSKNERLENYKKLFVQALDDHFLDDLRNATSKGLVLGRQDFIEKIEYLSNRRARSGKAGRPKKEIVL